MQRQRKRRGRRKKEEENTRTGDVRSVSTFVSPAGSGEEIESSFPPLPTRAVSTVFMQTNAMREQRSLNESACGMYEGLKVVFETQKQNNF